MISRFFIYRPIFATVLSIVIVLFGVVALSGLPIAQYPELAPPTVQVRAVYPGANATVIAETVAAPIEQEVNGAEGMIYMKSRSSSDGVYSLDITFEPEVDLDIATVQIQNRVSIASPRLPEDVRRQGITTNKRSPDFALSISLVSEAGADGKPLYDELFLQNYIKLRIDDVVKRISGVGATSIFGAEDYAMRVWLDPEKLQARNVTTTDVLDAIREQNVQVAAGLVGADPAPAGTAFQYTVTTLGRLSDAEQFENIIVKTGEDGRFLRVKDVARVELGARAYSMYSKLNGQPAATMLVYQLPGANLLEISERCKDALAELALAFPPGLSFAVGYDASDVINASIAEILETLFIAAGLVILTVWLFLQDPWATLIPSVTIPVSLIGTFFVMAMLGFSINTLTLFGLVLAIGIVVDDAILVVENVKRNIEESGLSPKDATIKAMEEVTGPVIATTLVLLAVFVPTAFMGGVSGMLYNQFGLTIAVATVFSSVNALTMSPALCGVFLRKRPATRFPPFRAFNALMEKSTSGYTKVAGLFVRKVALTLLLYAGIVAGAGLTLVNTPTGFVPNEDQGYAMINTQLPDAASAERTREVVAKIEDVVRQTPGIKYNISIGGFSLIQNAGGSNMASNILVFEPWDDRTTAATHSRGIVAHLNREFSKIQEGLSLAFETPAIPGFGNVSGFEMQVQDRVGVETLSLVTAQLIESGEAQAGLQSMFSGLRANVPLIFLDVDREKVKRLGIPLSDVFATLNAYMGSAYANDFNRFGRTWQVNVQADARFRAKVDDIYALRVRNAAGDMIPMSTLLQVREEFGPMILERYNLFPTATVNGSPAPGYSSGQAMSIMTSMASAELPDTMGFEWTGLSYQQVIAGSQAIFIFALAVLLVYLVLAAQYEAWGIPLAIILAVPMGVLGAFLSLLARQLDNNVYGQIGLVLLIALVAKNAIVIVEFARERRQGGMSIKDAAIDAARLRFRPILMTAISFILGTLPLLIATGAGAGSRVSLGTVVFGGMVFATAVGLLMTPGLYVIIQSVSELGRGRSNPATPEPAPALASPAAGDAARPAPDATPPGTVPGNGDRSDEADT